MSRPSGSSAMVLITRWVSNVDARAVGVQVVALAVEHDHVIGQAVVDHRRGRRVPGRDLGVARWCRRVLPVVVVAAGRGQQHQRQEHPRPSLHGLAGHGGSPLLTVPPPGGADRSSASVRGDRPRRTGSARSSRPRWPGRSAGCTRARSGGWWCRCSRPPPRPSCRPGPRPRTDRRRASERKTPKRVAPTRWAAEPGRTQSSGAPRSRAMTSMRRGSAVSWTKTAGFEPGGGSLMPKSTRQGSSVQGSWRGDSAVTASPSGVQRSSMSSWPRRRRRGRSGRRRWSRSARPGPARGCRPPRRGRHR